MSDLHVDDFFKDLAKILNLLYLQFPRKATVYVEDIAGPDEPDEFGLHSDRHMACFGALLWLAEEGFIRFESNIRQEAVDQAVLTARTFTLLSMAALHREPHDVTDLPELIRAEHSTNIHRLRAALRSRSSARIRKVMMDLLAQSTRVD